MEERPEHRSSEAAPGVAMPAGTGSADHRHEPAATPPMSQSTSYLKKELPWLLPLGVGVCALVVYLMTRGSRGSDLAQILSLLASAASLVATILIYRLERSKEERQPEMAKRRRHWPVLAAVLVTAVVSATSTALIVNAVLAATSKCIDENRRNPHEYLSGTLTIGINGRLPGWSKGQLVDDGFVAVPSGFDVDLIEFLRRKHNNFSVRYYAVTPAGRERALAECKVDLIIANYSMTQARDTGFHDDVSGEYKPPVDFAGPYFLDKSGLLCWQKKLDCDGPISQSSVCVVRGTIAERNLPGAEKANFISECMERFYMPGGAIGAYSTDKTILEAYGTHVGSVGTAVWAGQNNPISNEAYGIGLPDNSPELCNVLSRDIDEFLQQGGWESAFRDNLSRQEKYGRKPGGSEMKWCH